VQQGPFSEASRLCGTLFPGQMVEMQIGELNYREGERDKKGNRQIVPRTKEETTPKQDDYPYPDRQINHSEDFVDTPTPSSRLQVFVTQLKIGKLGKKDC